MTSRFHTPLNPYQTRTSFYRILFKYGPATSNLLKSIKIGILLLSFSLVSGQALAATQNPVYQPFVGHYKGHALLAEGHKKQQRDLTVDISTLDDGFRLQWQTVAYYKNKVKTKHYSIDFKSSKRANIFRSAMKKNLFGAPQPLDPMQGEPYIWSRFKDKTMTVYALLITDDGGYEFQVYDRTLTSDGMQLTFRRIRNNNILKTISARLLRQP